MKEINAILVCSQCHSIFDGRDMTAPCAKCGGNIGRAMTMQGFLDILDDSEAMDIIMESSLAHRVCDELWEDGWKYDPGYCHPKRLVRLKP